MMPVSAIELLDTLIKEAANSGASDIHLNPEKGRLMVRFRIDGELEDRYALPTSTHAPLLARIKVLSGLRTDEHFIGQDGRFKLAGTDSIDIRVSVAPTYYGENAVLRLLIHESAATTLRHLGCRNSHQDIVERALKRSHGMVLVTGPTGSGKTTFLYTLVQMLDSRTRSIVTIEDPIERSLPGINQIPANPGYGLSFADGLRSILRQDPDVIMVGEIRDAETARLATNAALTGHLVLSTLHTNDAPSAIPRLLDMGIESYLLASTVHLVVAQRLARRICTTCRITHIPQERTFDALRKGLRGEALPAKDFFVGAGCQACRGTGFKGRIGIFEMLIIDDTVRRAIDSRRDGVDIRAIARECGMSTLLSDGIRKAHKGLTTIEEVVRTCHE